MKGKMTGGGGGTAKAERKEKRLDAKGEKLIAKEVKKFDKDSNSTDPKKIASRYARNQVYQEKMGLIDKGIKPKGKMISKVKSNAAEKLQKLSTKESKKVSKMGQDAYWADNIYGSTTSRAKTYAAKVDKVESKAKEKVNKIIQKRAK
jgi:hypothetical protein